MHKSGHGTRLKALLRCKAQPLYTGIGYVAPELLVAILCFLTSCGEKMPECQRLCSQLPKCGFAETDCVLQNTRPPPQRQVLAATGKAERGDHKPTRWTLGNVNKLFPVQDPSPLLWKGPAPAPAQAASPVAKKNLSVCFWEGTSSDPRSSDRSLEHVSVSRELKDQQSCMGNGEVSLVDKNC